jgi:hypothetical protein
MHGILISCSQKRISQLESDPETLEDVVDARTETQIPGLLDLGSSWDALDLLLSARGKDPVLGDAVLARSGRELEDVAFEEARLIPPPRVAEVAKALAALPANVIAERTKGGDPEDIEALQIIFKRVVQLYQDAAKQKMSMLALRVE